MGKFDKLRGLMGQGERLGAKALGILDRPGRATRAALDALQEDQSVMDAIGGQLSGEAPAPPSGADIAEKFGERHDVQSPAALAAIATAADFIDPTMLIPGGQIAKIGKLGALAGIVKKGNTAADMLKKAKKSKFGRVAVVPTAQEIAEDALRSGRKTVSQSPVSLPPKKISVSAADEIGDEATQEVLSQFPELRKQLLEKRTKLERYVDPETIRKTRKPY